ncbi:unnamed protein product, partial [Darwinula stevensoni]
NWIPGGPSDDPRRPGSGWISGTPSGRPSGYSGGYQGRYPDASHPGSRGPGSGWVSGSPGRYPDDNRLSPYPDPSYPSNRFPDRSQNNRLPDRYPDWVSFTHQNGAGRRVGYLHEDRNGPEEILLMAEMKTEKPNRDSKSRNRRESIPEESNSTSGYSEESTNAEVRGPEPFTEEEPAGEVAVRGDSGPDGKGSGDGNATEGETVFTEISFVFADPNGCD